MANPFDHIHIKKRTAGSSNELSFDVLDAASNNLDSKKQRSTLPSSSPKPSQGSYTGVGGTSTLSAVPEVERRKRVRRNHSIRIGVLVSVLLLALIGVGAFVGYTYYQNKTTFDGQFSALIEEFKQVDKALVTVDELMVDSINTVEADKRTAILEQFSTLEAELDAIIAHAHALGESASLSNEHVMLSQVEEAAEARKGMLVCAADAFKLAQVANKQMTAANTAWTNVLAADNIAREATTIANTATTEEATQEAREKTEEAIDLLTSARKDLLQVQAEVTDLDYSAEVAYIDKRIEALGLAVDTANALLEGDRQAATTANESYNIADQEAAHLATSLTYSVTNKVKEQYADEVATIKESYNQHRAQAATSDSALRSYR